MKTDVSMPAASSSDFSHLAIVLDVTALYGFIRAINNAALTSAVRSCMAFIGLQCNYWTKSNVKWEGGERTPLLVSLGETALQTHLVQRTHHLAYTASHTNSAGIDQLI